MTAMLRDKVFKRMNTTNLNSPFVKYSCEIVKYQPQSFLQPFARRGHP